MGGETITVNIACPETGHAVGLTHGANAYPTTPEYYGSLGCMRNADDPDFDKLLTNNVDNINLVY